MFAEERDLLKDNKIKVIRLNYKEEVKKQKVYSNEELEKMDELFKAMTLYQSFMLGRYLGLRVGEVFGLTWDDIDFENRTVSINKQMAIKDKAGEEKEWVLKDVKTSSGRRVIDMTSILLDYLKELKRKQESTKYKYKTDNYKFYDEDNNYVKTLKSPNFVNLRADGKSYNEP